MHKVFISHHHSNDQAYKDALLAMNGEGIKRIFIDGSVDTGDIDENLTDEQIRVKIRDEYLRDTTVTIVLVGIETKGRKHVDWEIHSSMFDGAVNKKSGILVVVLPSADNNFFTAAHGDREKVMLYPEIHSWGNIDSRAEYERRYPYLSGRLIDNLLESKVKMSVVQWDKIFNEHVKLGFLIEESHNSRTGNDYDMSNGLMGRNL